MANKTDNFAYFVGGGLPSFDSLPQARSFMKHIIKEDLRTRMLNRDNFGRFYIVRWDMRANKSKIFPLYT